MLTRCVANAPAWELFMVFHINHQQFLHHFLSFAQPRRYAGRTTQKKVFV